MDLTMERKRCCKAAPGGWHEENQRNDTLL